MRRAEIAIGVVIMITLGLIVLLVLGVLLSGQVFKANKTLNACEETYGGTCLSSSACGGIGGKSLGANSCGKGHVSEGANDWVVVSFPEGGLVCCKTV